jgi:uncharacterized protein YukE
MITQKEAELEVIQILFDKLALLTDHPPAGWTGKYHAKYQNSLNKWAKILNKRFQTVDNKIHPVEGEA